MEDQQSQIIEAEKEICALMTRYASNDCFAITKLHQMMKPFESPKVVLKKYDTNVLDEELLNNHNDRI